MSPQEPRTANPSDCAAPSGAAAGLTVGHGCIEKARISNMRFGSKACLFSPRTMKLSPLQFNPRILWTTLTASSNSIDQNFWFSCHCCTKDISAPMGSQTQSQLCHLLLLLLCALDPRSPQLREHSSSFRHGFLVDE